MFALNIAVRSLHFPRRREEGLEFLKGRAIT